MSKTPVNHPSDDSVDDYVASLPTQRQQDDSRTLIEMMRDISGHEPRLWNGGTIGFDQFEYRYASGHHGVCQTISFRPSARQLTVYLMDGTARYAEQLAHLGPHTTSKACLYIRNLDAIDLGVLRAILSESYRHLSTGGDMHRKPAS